MIGIGPKARYTDETVNRFKKTNLLYTEDPFMLYQDPTYLGFKLFFEFEYPDHGLMTLSETPGPNTALGYLTAIGDKYRANYLRKFISTLQNINLKTPWFFQTIEGLDQAWKRGFQEEEFKAMLPKDRKIVIGCEESIDLRMTALMDFYRKACFDWYARREVVPWNLRTFNVYIYIYEARKINKDGKPSPSGMLDLSKLLGLSDINKKQQKENYRLMGEPLGKPDGEGALARARSTINSAVDGIKQNPITGIGNALNPEKSETIDSPDPKITRVLYRFKMCEWLPDESSEIFTKVGNVIGDRATQKIAFSYRDVEEINLYTIYSRDLFVRDKILGLMDLATFDAPFKKEEGGAGGWSLDSVLNDNNFGKLVAPFAALGAQQIERLISSYAGKLLMGNIYGFSAGQALSQVGGILSGDPTAVVAGAAGLANQIIPSASKRNNSGKIGLNEPYFDSVTANRTLDRSSIGNTYEEAINRTNDVDNLGNTYNAPINQTNDVDNLGNTYEPPINQTNDVDNLGNTYNAPTNQTNDVDSIGNVYE
jgi:hypothetical protein